MELQQMGSGIWEEVSKRMFRKGGYNDIVKKMVIAASLNRGEFNDVFLFQKQ